MGGVAPPPPPPVIGRRPPAVGRVSDCERMVLCSGERVRRTTLARVCGTLAVNMGTPLARLTALCRRAGGVVGSCGTVRCGYFICGVSATGAMAFYFLTM